MHRQRPSHTLNCHTPALGSCARNMYGPLHLRGSRTVYYSGTLVPIMPGRKVADLGRLDETRLDETRRDEARLDEARRGETTGQGNRWELTIDTENRKIQIPVVDPLTMMLDVEKKTIEKLGGWWA